MLMLQLRNACCFIPLLPCNFWLYSLLSDWLLLKVPELLWSPALLFSTTVSVFLLSSMYSLCLKKVRFFFLAPDILSLPDASLLSISRWERRTIFHPLEDGKLIPLRMVCLPVPLLAYCLLHESAVLFQRPAQGSLLTWLTWLPPLQPTWTPPLWSHHLVHLLGNQTPVTCETCSTGYTWHSRRDRSLFKWAGCSLDLIFIQSFWLF